LSICQDPTFVNVGGAVTLNVSLLSEDEGIFSGGVRRNRREKSLLDSTDKLPPRG